MRDLGGYRVEAELAGGGLMAAAAVGRRVVLKPLDEDCLLRGQLHPMIKDRLGRVRELAHLGVANLLGVERLEGTCYSVWQYAEGRTLEEYLGDGDRGACALRDLALRLVQSIEALHALGIVHGALHARNIIIESDGGLRLTHISPLLYGDPEVDVEALLELLPQLGHGQPEREGLPTLRQIAAQLTAAAKMPAEPAVEMKGRADGVKVRRAALIGAAVAVVLGAGVAWGVWRYASWEADREPAYPELRPAATGEAGGGLGAVL